MNIFLKIPTLKMNQTNQSGSGNGGGTSNQSQGTSQFTPPKEGGSGSNQSGAATGQQSSEANQDPYSSAGDGDSADLGQYGADGKLKEPAPKKQEAVDLKYKIEGLEDLSDDEATQIKEFAKNNRFSKEQAQAYLSQYKSLSDKTHTELKNFETANKNKDLEYKRGEAKKLKELIGGKDGAEFKANYNKLGQFIGKHLPAFKKELDGGNFFPPSSVMKELFDMQEKLTKEDSLVNGGAAGGKQSASGGLFGFFGGNKT